MTRAELRKLRKAAGVTQADLAEQLDTWQSVISEMETGVRPINRWTELAVRYVLINAHAQAQPSAHRRRDH